MICFKILVAFSRLILPLVAMVCAGLAQADPPPAEPPSPPPDPSAILDLSHWHLTIPVNADGVIAGARPIQITEKELKRGYSSEYFQTSPDGGVTFWCPNLGTKATDRVHPRTELREKLKPGRTDINWLASMGGTLKATLAINQVPDTGGAVIVGQIHGWVREGRPYGPLVKIIYDFDPKVGFGTVRAALDDAPLDAKETLIDLETRVPLNQKFSYKIRVRDNKLFLNRASGIPIPPAWEGAALYFKAGACVLAEGKSESDGGKATFYTLTAKHP